MSVKIFTPDRNHGFSLIEVLIGIFVAAVGIVGVLQLQKVYIQSGSQANARVIAMQLTREQFDNIKNTDAFDTIITGTDAANPISRSNFSFRRGWTVTDRYYNQTSGAWQTNTTGIVPVPGGPDGKEVVVTVSWTDTSNNSQQVQQTEHFSKVSLHDSSTVTANLNPTGGPKVPYIPINSPESPPITLLDNTMDVQGIDEINTKETSKPIPTVYANNRHNLIQFETVVFDSDTETQTLEDFATVNCSCSFQGSAEAKTPVTMTIEGGELINDVDSGAEITKRTGAVNSTDQPFLCNKCCEGHHDSDDSDAKFVAGSSGDHPHFLDISMDAVSGGDYLEACRFRRIDGFYELVPDWVLVKFIIMPQGYFLDADNVTAYTAHVKAVVKAYMKGTGMPAALTGRDITGAVAGSQQLIARGIYVDKGSLSVADLATVLTEIDSNPQWLELVPFHELNLTLFVDWSTSNTTVGTVTQQDINTIVDVSQNYYGTYSRGRLTTLADGDATITAKVNLDNTGITGSGSIIPIISSGASATLTTDSITVNVDTTGSGNNTITIELNCLSLNNQNELAACPAQDTADVVVLHNPGNISCTYTAQQGNSTATADCSSVTEHWSGDISLSKSGYSFEYFKYVDDVLVPIEGATSFSFSATAPDIVITGQSSNTLLKVVMTQN